VVGVVVTLIEEIEVFLVVPAEVPEVVVEVLHLLDQQQAVVLQVKDFLVVKVIQGVKIIQEVAAEVLHNKVKMVQLHLAEKVEMVHTSVSVAH
tara:strand:+ start:285 stop:563 length:279 start_codon:yes stop_codon:yes gene_type:complete